MEKDSYYYYQLGIASMKNGDIDDDEETSLKILRDIIIRNKSYKPAIQMLSKYEEG